MLQLGCGGFRHTRRTLGCCVKNKSHEAYTAERAAADFGSRLSRRDLRAYWCASFVGDLDFKGKSERKTRSRGIPFQHILLCGMLVCSVWKPSNAPMYIHGSA